MGEGADETLAWPAPLPHSSAQLYSLAEQGFPAMDGTLANLFNNAPLCITMSVRFWTVGSFMVPALSPP